MYCSTSQVVLVVRRRPLMVGGGGFVVTNCTQKVLFQVAGCGTLGRKGELMLLDSDGDAVLLIRQQGGIVQALSIHKKWKGYYDNEGLQKMVFGIKEPNACFSRTNAIRISTEPKTHHRGRRDWDFEVEGYFPDRDCRILDSTGNVIAQVGTKEEIVKVMKSNDVYHVVVQPGVDQAFVCGVIAVLDYIYHESTRC
ncbi:hypothetical protein KSS87_011305 [Heliosperma pusillum]|nr:hypothetical protein KSS87_011305 [Heliosperma pusillum]